jgi:PTH2 family peptidyl-tRNA hydrolase
MERLQMQVKEVLVIRTDLNMRRGKEIAQGTHAGSDWMRTELLSAYFENRPPLLSSEQLEWASNEQYTKVVLQAESHEQLKDVYNAAKEAGLDVRLITDLGKTEFHGVPTETCLCIGPDLNERIDAITGRQGKFPLKTY